MPSPHDRLRHHVTGAIERGEAEPIVAIPTEPAPFDFEFTNHGSIITMAPNTEAAREWIDENIGDDAMMFGNAVAIEPRYLDDIFDGIEADGLTTNLRRA